MSESIWQRAKETVRDAMDHATYQRWIAPLRFLERKNGAIIVGCPNAFFKEWIERHHRDILQEAMGGEVRLHLRVARENRGKPASKLPTQMSFSQLAPSPLWNTGLNALYTFDRFVVGPCNEFAYHASEEVAKSPDTRYNPLLLLADVGLGKSHLSCAIGNYIVKNDQANRVCYTTAEGFVNEMVRAIRSKHSEAFKEKFRRQCDVLVIDGVQFLSGKVSTQMELANTLDALFHARKRIVLTSNRLVHEIPEMDEALRSRISGGLVVDIEPPDPATRMKILHTKARQEGVHLPDAVAEYLAHRITGNVRQLESALIHLLAKASLLHRPLDMDLAVEATRQLLKDNSMPAKPSIEQIKRCVCRYFKMDHETLVGKSRKKSVYYPRQIAMHLCRKHTDATLTSIGRAFNRDHASVIHSLAVIQKRCKLDPQARRQVEFLSEQILKTRS